MLLAGCAAAPPLPPGTPAFGLMGDTPYSVGEVERLDRLIDDMNAADLAFVVHVGDITSGLGPCTDDWFQARKKQFGRLRHPFVLLPGDNDWTDCHRTGFDPVERLQHWRSLFCFTEKMPVERQAGPYCEHVRWESAGYLFVALDVQGSNNNRGRTAAMDREYEERMKAVDAWIDDAERAFEARKLKGLVLMMQANPFLTPRSGPSGFTGIVQKLKALGRRHPLQVVLVNGDTHTYRDDVPLPGVRRIEVPGSPFVDWLRAAVINGELHVVPAGGR